MNKEAVRRLAELFLFFIAIITVIFSVISLLNSCESNTIYGNQINNYGIVNTDAIIVAKRQSKNLFYRRSNTITFVKDIHGHIGKIYGDLGELGTIIEIQCNNGEVRGY